MAEEKNDPTLSKVEYQEKDGFLQIWFDLDSSMRIVYIDINGMLHHRMAVIQYFYVLGDKLMIVACTDSKEYSQITLSHELAKKHKTIITKNCNMIENNCAYVFHQKNICGKIEPFCIMFELKKINEG